MSGPFSYPILRNVTSDRNNTYGVTQLANGTITVVVDSVTEDSIILLSRKTNSTNPGGSGAIGLTRVANGFFIIRSTVSDDNGRIYVLILRPTSVPWPSGTAISLPIINLTNSYNTIGPGTLFDGTVNVFNIPVTPTSIIFLSRFQNTALSKGQLTAVSGTNSFDVNSTDPGDNGTFYFFVIQPSTDPVVFTSDVVHLPKLDTSAGNQTFGVAILSGGTVTVNTTAVNSMASIFLTKASYDGTIGTQSYCVSSKTVGASFTIQSTSATDTSSINWWIVSV